MTGFGKIRRNALLGVLLCATLCAGFPSCSGRSEQGGETATTTAATTRETAGETAEETTDSAGGTGTLYAHVQSVYPVPLSLTLPQADAAGRVPAIPATLSVGAGAAAYEELLRELGLLSAQTDALPLTIVQGDLSDRFPGGADEGYLLKVSQTGVEITAGSERGVYYALVTLSALRDGDSLPCLEIADAPAVAERGVIEGFYGTAWSDNFRKELLSFMGQQKMNTYIYAPKDDEKHRSRWREQYTSAELAALKGLVDCARENRVSFVYAISPGIDINLGSGYGKDFSKLTAKCEQLWSIGVRDFAVLLDDIPTLNAEGHAKLLNDFQTQFIRTHEGASDLICITTEYTDPMLTAYTDRIAPLLDPALRLMWTGPGVAPASINASDLTAINKKYGRKVYLWWNYPVNDVLADHLNMAPCQGLDKKLAEAVSGFVANPMNQGHASLYPLFTVADYLWNPTAYDADRSARAAATYLAGDAADAAMTFIDLVGACPQNGNVSTVPLGKLIAAWRDGSGQIAPILTLLRKTTDDLRLLRQADPALAAEAGDWFDKSVAMCNMAIAYFEAEEAHAAGNSAVVYAKADAFRLAMESVAGNSRVVSPNVLAPLLSGVTHRFNVLAGFAEPATSQKATGITNASHYENYTVDRICDGDDSTYFWSHGAMWQAASGTTGYVGLDFGEIVRVRNLYIATGEEGTDVFTNAAIEYSADRQSWTELCAGQFGEEIFLEGLDFDARYVRMRNTDTQSNAWVKVRVFEANTNRRATPNSGKPGLSTSFNTYQDYAPDRITDGKADTFFWAGRAVEAGDYVMIDLGAPCHVTAIGLETGVGGHTADYMHSAQVQYSADGYVWHVLGNPGQGKVTYDGLDLTARYVRLIATAGQTNWFTMSMFTVVHDDYRHPTLSSDLTDLAPTQFGMLADRNVLTALSIPSGNAGKTLTILLGESRRVTAFFTAEDATGYTIAFYDGNGQKLSEEALQSGRCVENPAAAIAVITFGGGSITVSEILAD